MVVWDAPDVTAPSILIAAPALTNRSPITFTGWTEPGASVTMEGRLVDIAAEGQFTITTILTEGNNLLNFVATDAVGNAASYSQTIVLDRIAPTLAVTFPTDDMTTNQGVIQVTGMAEVKASVIVSGMLVNSDPTNGAFSAFFPLKGGVNVIPISAIDAANNSIVITRSVMYDPAAIGYSVYLPAIQRNYTPIMANLDAAPTSGTAPLTVTFANTSLGSIYQQSMGLW